MDQANIGKFIQKLRKEKNMTQKELADKLFVTENAIGNWENGRRIPDYSILKQLCEILDTNFNELLSGKRINDYKEEAEQNFEILKKQEERYNKIILALEDSIKLITIIAYISILYAEINAEGFNKYIFMFLSVFVIIISFTIIVHIEKNIGYYECGNCKHKYIPQFISIYFSLNKGKNRYLKCPKCKKRSWNKKVTTRK